MKKSVFILLFLIIFLIACGSATEPDTTVTTAPEITEIQPIPTETDDIPATATITEAPKLPTVTPTEGKGTEIPAAKVEGFEGLPLVKDRGRYFAGSGACAICHTNMQDQSGADVSIDSFWRSTMMANAARDPYWQANVLSELLSNPGLEEIIEAKCTTCHMPMARTTSALEGDPGKAFGDGYLDPDHPLHSLAMDGVSCTLCHQVESANLGTEDSFSGGFLIDENIPEGERLNFGPYEVDEIHSQIMQVSSGFIPVQGTHIQESQMCATCHTLYTPTVNRSGEVTGLFPEQMAYFEWLASDLSESRSCQDCHMPGAQGGVQLSITGSDPREPFSKHIFVGGNVYMLHLFRLHGTEMDVTASSDQFENTIARVLDQLQNRTAAVSIEDISQNGSLLKVDVLVENHTGHKFPTGFPSRRAWIHLVLEDANGNVIFESGKWTADGQISGNENDANQDSYEEHYTLIEDPEQVQIYETIIGEENDTVTTELLRGSGYLKDNRLLPSGFDKFNVSQDIAVYGNAVDDNNFLGGSDLLSYRIDLGDSSGPYTLKVELVYQSIGYRWANNLERHSGEEIEYFLDYYSSLPNQPVVVSRETREIK